MGLLGGYDKHWEVSLWPTPALESLLGCRRGKVGKLQQINLLEM